MASLSFIVPYKFAVPGLQPFLVGSGSPSFPTGRPFIILSLGSLRSPASYTELPLEQNRGCAVNYSTVTQMKLIYYSLRVKIKQNNTVLIAISTIKLWLIYKLGFYYLLQFIHTLSGSSWWATKDCSHFFL